MNIQVILGSTRPERTTERVAKWVTAAAQALPGLTTELIDLADYDLPHFNEPASPRMNQNRQPAAATRRWLDKISQADGYIIVTPEYNHSFPGVLKDALDHIDWQFTKKPVALVGHGSVGGARAVEQLKLVVSFLGAAIVPESIALMNAARVLDADGNYTGDTASPYGPNQQLTRLLTELAWWTRALKAAHTLPASQS
jgi:NAD(P)H-dependent FMN reductase